MAVKAAISWVEFDTFIKFVTKAKMEMSELRFQNFSPNIIRYVKFWKIPIHKKMWWLRHSLVSSNLTRFEKFWFKTKNGGFRMTNSKCLAQQPLDVPNLMFWKILNQNKKMAVTKWRSTQPFFLFWFRIFQKVSNLTQLMDVSANG